MIQADYHDLDSLKQSTWEKRTEVLTQGGYTHYREKTATALGQVAEMLDKKYNGDVRGLAEVDKGDCNAKKVYAELSMRLKQIKGLGSLGVDIFFGTAQSFIPQISPFISKRDIQVFIEIGLESDLDKLFHEVGNDATNMARLNAALTKLRLDKHVSEFT